MKSDALPWALLAIILAVGGVYVGRQSVSPAQVQAANVQAVATQMAPASTLPPAPQQQEQFAAPYAADGSQAQSSNSAASANVYIGENPQSQPPTPVSTPTTEVPKMTSCTISVESPQKWGETYEWTVKSDGPAKNAVVSGLEDSLWKDDMPIYQGELKFKLALAKRATYTVKALCSDGTNWIPSPEIEVVVTQQ